MADKRKLLLTGARGFLGREIEPLLADSFEVLGLGRGPSNDIQADLSIEVPEIPEVEVVVHAAGKAHVVPKTPEEEKAFHDINTGGTENLLKALDEQGRTQGLDHFIFISTVAVYGRDSGEGITVDHPLNGTTPYALSKIKAEELVREWGSRTGVKISILRLPLIWGENDPPGNLGAMIQAMKRGYYFRIGKGEARRSIIKTETLGRMIAAGRVPEGTHNITEEHHPTIREIEDQLARRVGRSWIPGIPLPLLRFGARLGDRISFLPLNTYRLEKLITSLTFQ